MTLINPASQDASIYAALRFGFRVDRAAAALPQTTAHALYTISGGLVALLAIVGEVTTIIETQDNNTKLVANPTVGTSVDICAVLNITADEVGCLYGITGTIGDALVGTNAGAAPLLARPLVLPVGTLDLDCAASNTGAIKWKLWYIPLESGASVAAA